MPIPETEQLRTLAEARKFMPSICGRHPSIPTLWRWCRKGIQGVRLEYVRVGRTIATSREAVLRFFNALALADRSLVNPAAADSQSVNVASTSARAASLEMADRILERAGI